jgi:peptidylprolyl isomerase
MQSAKAGDTVRVHYRGTLDDGSVFDSSEGRDPLQFTLGSGQVIPGFDNAVTGMNVGDERTVTIPAAEAYGTHRDDLVLVVGRDNLPPDLQVQIGDRLQLDQGGHAFTVIVTDLTDHEITLDANHPLAGRNLTFALQLVEIA